MSPSRAVRPTSSTPGRPARPSAGAVHRELGRAARKAVPRSTLGAWTAPADRPDPVATLQAQNVDRVQELVPLRFERMSASPFAFYRGGAAIMAQDLGGRPRTSLQVQLAGDAHLANFGGFATPERTMVFDLNDFDETHPGPFEWDMQRLAASFVIAGRHRGFASAEVSRLVDTLVRTYCSAMTGFSTLGLLDVWYARIQAADILERWGAGLDPARIEAFQKRLQKARARTSVGAVSRYTRVGDDGQLHIISNPPFVVPVTELLADQPSLDLHAMSQSILDSYRTTLSDDRNVLLSAFQPIDAARKVVGVGSVGTRCWITLLVATDDDNDDLVLQLKQAGPSVLESVTEPSRYANHGQRVVEGQRLMQSASDALLGWTQVTGPDGVARDYYVRQMWDWKTAANLDTIDHQAMGVYASLCGWTLARAHARTGDRQALAAYLGSGRSFVRAMQDFAESYADQNQRDYDGLLAAIAAGRVVRSHLEERTGAGA